MTRLVERWRTFWFAPELPTNLGFCRVAFFTGMLWLEYPMRLHAWAGMPPVYRRPMSTFHALRLPFLSANEVFAMEVLWVVALVLSAIGLFTRAATAAAFALGFYLLALGNNFGKIGHGDQALALTLLILALSRCGDALSADAWLAGWRRRRRGEPALPPPRPSGEYRWPIRMVWLLMALIFCAAGASKLVRSGFAWITSDHLAMTLIQAHHYRYRPWTNIGLYLARYPLLCNMMAGGVVVLELAFPLALMFKRLRAPIVLATLLMQVGIGLLMAVWFRQFLFLYVFWVPWGRVGARLAAWLSRLRAETVAGEPCAADNAG